MCLVYKENAKDSSLYVEGLDDVHKLMKDFWNMVNNRQKVSCNILTDSMAVDVVHCFVWYN